MYHAGWESNFACSVAKVWGSPYMWEVEVILAANLEGHLICETALYASIDGTNQD